MMALIILAVAALIMVLIDYWRLRRFRKKRRSSRSARPVHRHQPDVIAATAPVMSRWERFTAQCPQLRELIWLPIPVFAALAATALALALT